MARKNNKETSVVLETPKPTATNVLRLKPLRIEQPVEIIQSVVLKDEEKKEEPKPEETSKKSRRRKNK